MFRSLYDNALRWIPQDLTDEKSTLVQVMVWSWCHQATSHYPSQCWHSSVSLYGITRPQWVKQQIQIISYQTCAGSWDSKNWWGLLGNSHHWCPSTSHPWSEYPCAENSVRKQKKSGLTRWALGKILSHQNICKYVLWATAWVFFQSPTIYWDLWERILLTHWLLEDVAAILN